MGRVLTVSRDRSLPPKCLYEWKKESYLISETKNQSEKSLKNTEISLQLRSGASITPAIVKDIAKMIKFVEEMEHIRKTYCPRCRDRAIRELQAQYGVKPYDEE